MKTLRIARSTFMTLLFVGFMLVGLHEASASIRLSLIAVHPFGSVGNFLIHAVLWLPLLVALAGIIALRVGRAANQLLWFIVLWWGAVGAVGLLELVQPADYIRIDATPARTVMRLISILVLSILGLAFLLWDVAARKRGSSSG